MNRSYKISVVRILCGIAIPILAIYICPAHSEHILLAVLAAIWYELAFGIGSTGIGAFVDLITGILLEKLQIVKKALREYLIEIDLYIHIELEYTKPKKKLIKDAIKKIQSEDEIDREMGFEILPEFKGDATYEILLKLLKIREELYMKTKKILWIDYDTDSLIELVKPLEKDGYKIMVANNEKEALETIEKSKSDFDLILSDIIIPPDVKRDAKKIPFVEIGMRLLKTLLIDKKIKTPIIVLSVVSDKEKIGKMYDMGVKKFLQKREYLSSKLREEIYKVLEVQD